MLLLCGHFFRDVMLCWVNGPKLAESDQLALNLKKLNAKKVVNSQLFLRYTPMDIFL